MGTQDRTPEPRPHESLAFMSLGEHLEELRWRLIKCLLAIGAAFVVCWVFRARLWPVLARPHVLAMRAFELDPALKFSSYFEAVVAQLKACIIVALTVTAPYLIHQVWAFVAPGLFPQERRKALKLGAACAVCFAAGVAFGYFAFVPVALRYLIRLSGGWAEPVLMISNYLSAFFLLTFALGVAFQTPVVIFYLIRWGVLDVEALRRRRKGVILGAFVLAAVITPPDPFTQVMMALTLIVLYDLGGLLAAPSRATLTGFFKFTGAVLAVGAVAAAWFTFWPVARVELLAGRVSLNGSPVQAAAPMAATRGAVCRTEAEGAALLAFRGKEGARVYLAGATRLQVHGPAAVSLYDGDCLVVANGARAFTLHAGAGTATLMGGEAEFSARARRELRVTAVRGEVHVKSGGQVRVIGAGETATFQTGGAPADLEETTKRWLPLTGH